jgi:hypothetical protein
MHNHILHYYVCVLFHVKYFSSFKQSVKTLTNSRNLEFSIWMMTSLKLVLQNFFPSCAESIHDSLEEILQSNAVPFTSPHEKRHLLIPQWNLKFGQLKKFQNHLLISLLKICRFSLYNFKNICGKLNELRPV